ncbi:MAG: CatB-related O-acetyltransferase [Sedimentisphaerales bacterium]|nr:CatB-related O-acetyltransferase [Sedimentisphaerales bacterium]
MPVKEGRDSRILSKLIMALYGIKSRKLRHVLLSIIMGLEGGPIYSNTLRRIFKKFHGVEIGMYTHGSCFVPGNFDKFTTVGRYCSIAQGVYVHNRDHPVDFKSTHAFFFNAQIGHVKEDKVGHQPLVIGNDVWIGRNVVILPHVTEIGDGVVIGANSVVSRNLPPYAVALGHPARIVRYRFPPDTIALLLKSKWWEKDIQEINGHLEEYTQPYEAYVTAHQLIQRDTIDSSEQTACSEQENEI